MNLAEDIKPISYIKTHASQILKNINENKRPLYITQNGEAKAVLLDAQSYEQMQKSLALLKLLTLSEKDIEQEKLIKQEELFKNLQDEFSDESSK